MSQRPPHHEPMPPWGRALLIAIVALTGVAVGASLVLVGLVLRAAWEGPRLTTDPTTAQWAPAPEPDLPPLNAVPSAPPPAPTVGSAEAPTPPAVPADLQLDEVIAPGSLPGEAAPAPSAEDPVEEPEGEVLTSDRVVVRLYSEPPGAQITVDKRPRGRTPAKLMLNPGEYAVVLTLEQARVKLPLHAERDQRHCFVAQGRKLVSTDCTEMLDGG